ncbi:MAG: ISAs1 family transposase [Cyanobacteriota bacterium]
MIPLITYLEKLEDPRKNQGKRYDLIPLLSCCFIATICGYKNYSGFSEFCKNYKEKLLDVLDFRGKNTPCASTFFNVLKRVGIKNFEKVISEWVESFLDKTEVISIDGKTLRGTKKQGGKYNHLLSAFVNRLGITLYQNPVETKTNEITGVIELLKGITIEGKIFTMDALLTQKAIAKKIVSNKGDYIMVAKDNQAFLKEDIELLVYSDENYVITESYIENDKGHGRIETRKITITESKDIIEFEGVQQVFMVERWIKRNGKETYEKIFGLSSLSKAKADAKSIFSMLRSHWSIENRSHWVRDVTYDEDRSQVKDSKIAEFMALFRNIAIGLIRFDGFVNISKANKFYASNPILALPLLTMKIK